MSDTPPEDPSRWRQIQAQVYDLAKVTVRTEVDADPLLRIESTHDLLQGDVDTQIDAALMRPERAWVRTQHVADQAVSGAVRAMWVDLFRQWARLDEALEEGEG